MTLPQHVPVDTRPDEPPAPVNSWQLTLLGSTFGLRALHVDLFEANAAMEHGDKEIVATVVAKLECNEQTLRSLRSGIDEVLAKKEALPE